MRIKLLIFSLLFSVLGWGQLFQQDFNSSSLVTDYANASPSNGQFNAISTSGAGAVWSINSSKLRVAWTATNAFAATRTTAFSGGPTSLMLRFDLQISGNSSAVTGAFYFSVGDGYSTANSAPAGTNTHSRFAINTTTTNGTFAIRRNESTATNSANLSGNQTITWVINNSGGTLSYKAPDGTCETVVNDTWDVWAGTTKIFNDIAALTGTQALNNFKIYSNTAATVNIDIDNMLIEPIPVAVTSTAPSGINSSGFTANWNTVTGVTGYRVDVATDAVFTALVPGYNNLYVSGVSTNSLNVTGLNPSTQYYYRVRAVSQYTIDEFSSCSSTTQNLTTTAGGCTPPADPVGTISVTQNCGTTDLNFSDNTTVNWYWQTSATGTSTTNPTTSTYNVNTSGTYYVRAYDGASCWSNGTVSQAIIVYAPVSITTQPTNQTVTAPSTATFNVVATGSGLSYQWEVSTNGGGTWSPIGTNSNSYITPATTTGMSGYLYHVVVSGTAPCTVVTSNNVSLTVNAAPVSKTYTLCTSTADLISGANYIIASTQSGSAQVLGYQNTNNRPQATVTGGAPFAVTSSQITLIPATVSTNVDNPYEITLGGSSGAWTLRDAVSGNYLAATGGNSNNYLKTGSGSWTISFSSNAAIMTDVSNTSTTPRNVIMYNSASSLFSCYNSGQSSVYLYRENVPGPEINIKQASAIPSGTGSYDFGNQAVSVPSTAITFTIQNQGAVNALSLTGTPIVAISGANASDFSINQSSTSATVAANGSTTFTIVFTPSASGIRTATISIANDDVTGSENPYTFTITGNGTNIINNDLCSNAISLVVNAAPIAGDMTGSTRTAAPFNNKPDVWYTFTATCSSTHAITVSGFTGDIDIELFSGSCPATTTFLDESNGTTSTETISIALTAGTTYYLRVLAFNAAAQTSAFNVGVTAGSSLNISNTGSPVAGNITTGTNNVVIMGVTTTPACATSYDLTSIALTNATTSTVATTDISNFRIFYDANSNGVVDGGEASVSGAGIALSASMNFTLGGQTGLTTERRYLLVADVSATAVVGRKIKVDLSPNSNLVATINPAGTKNGIALGNVQTIVTPTCTPATIVSVMPTSGPVGTQVTITASSGNLTSATASFNGVAATIVSSSATQLVVIVPSGATTGNLIITDSQPCSSAAIPFTVVDKDITSCQSSSLITDLFISEVTDASSGSLTYVEIYNGTSNSIDMAALNYAVRITNYNATLNDGASGVDVDLPLAGVLAPGGKFIFGTTVGTACSVPGGNGSLANQSGVHSGINNNDLVKLVKGGTVIDVWGVADDTRFWITDLGLGDRGYDFERKNSVSAPSTTFSVNDWVVIDWDSCSDDYSNIATYIPVVTTPVITAQPTISVTCTTTSATLSVTANEGFVGGNPLAYQWYVVAPNTASWSTVTDGGVYSGATTANLAISSVANLDGYQFYCQVRENTATCYTASTAVLISVPSTVWNGSVWTKGAPDTTKIAVIDGNYDTDTATAPGSFECCSLFVNTGYTLVVRDGDFVSVVNNITNNGTLNIDNNGSLVQVNDTGINTGNINMQRTAFIDFRDYVYWSTPVANFNSANISTFSNNSNLYKWIPTVSGNGVGDFGNWTSGVETMVLGKGYIERGLNNAPLNSPVNFTSTFTGVPNNGSITTSISRGTYNTVGSYPSPYSPTNATQDDDNWNLLGNPYPSSISADLFLTANSSNLDGFVKIWLHGIAPSTSALDPFYNNYSYNYDPNDYLTYNLSGPSTPGVFDGYIGAGQGFITRMSASSTFPSANAVFNNSMRSKTFRNDQFYKNANTDSKGRIWIDLVSSTTSNSTLIAYVNGATNGKDQMYDASANLKANFSIYSLVDGYDRNVIQGRSLPFDQNDQVPLAIKIPSNGNYTIAIKDVDGFFTNPSQSIYLEDKQANVIHDLRSAPYYFTSTSGEFVERFVLRYTNQTLGNDQFEVLDNSVRIYASENSIVINSSVEPIKTYEIYNVLGQTLVSKKQLNVNNAEENSIQKNNQALIVKVTLENGKTINKKVIF